MAQSFTEQDIQQLTQQQAEKIANQTKIPLRAVEWFALEKGLTLHRYQRNIGSLGAAGQKALLEKKVIVVGLGGLGGYVLEELARAGLGQIVGVDPDIFDETNLNRQLLAELGNLGKSKVPEAKKRLQKINKAVEFTGFADPFDKLPEQTWSEADLVFDCLDNIEDRLKLADNCSLANVPLVHGAIGGWYGEVGIVWPGTGTLAKMYGSRRKGIEQYLGTPPFTAAITASLMVAKGIKLLTEKTSAREQKMLFFDLLQDDWQTMTF